MNKITDLQAYKDAAEEKERQRVMRLTCRELLNEIELQIQLLIIKSKAYKDDKCYYCESPISKVNDVFYHVRKAIKPKGCPNRYVRVGTCCSTCYDSGKKVIVK